MGSGECPLWATGAPGCHRRGRGGRLRESRWLSGRGRWEVWNNAALAGGKPCRESHSGLISPVLKASKSLLNVL